jgi:hypothetical protein
VTDPTDSELESDPIYRELTRILGEDPEEAGAFVLLPLVMGRGGGG